MDWTNILDAAGLTLSVDLGSGTSGIGPPSDIDTLCAKAPFLAAGATHISSTYVGGDIGWNTCLVTLEDAGDVTLPCNIRVTLTEKLSAAGASGGDGALATGDSSFVSMDEAASRTSPQTYSATGVLAAVGDPLIRFLFSGSGEYFESTNFIIEVDGGAAPGAKWTDFRGTFEDAGTLVKPPQLVYIPPVEPVEAFPASYDCYPPPPPSPIVPPSPPDGNGSGPPSGDCQMVPVFGQVTMCANSDPAGPISIPQGSAGAVAPCTTVSTIVGYVQVCP